MLFAEHDFSGMWRNSQTTIFVCAVVSAARYRPSGDQRGEYKP
jgi:hypothetical protein